MAHTFRGGVHLDGMKRATRAKPLEPMPAPDWVALPVIMHTGEPCEPVVAVGDEVLLGQQVAAGENAAPVHSPCSGKVTAIEPRPHPNGGAVLSIVIENDFQDTPAPGVVPHGSAESLGSDEIVEMIRDAGVVDPGGGKPAHMKILDARGRARTLVVNCTESEPYITSGYRGIVEYTTEIVEGARLVMRALDASAAIFAVEANMPDAAARLEQAVGEGMSVQVLRSKYPQSGEGQIVSALCGGRAQRVRAPEDAGYAVFGAETCAAVWRAWGTGLPLVTCNVTVAGDAVANPRNLICRIGTPAGKLFEAAGGFLEEPQRLIVGGVMTGRAISSLATPIIKGTSGLLALAHTRRGRATQCIRCGRCIAVCPEGLLPLYIDMYNSHNMTDRLERLGVLSCTECGACAYVCPGRLPLVQACREAKASVRELEGVAK